MLITIIMNTPNSCKSKSNNKTTKTNNATIICTNKRKLKDDFRAQFSEVFLQKYVLPTPSFTFGGVTGNTVTAVVFQKT